jgi:hypothetical protein
LAKACGHQALKLHEIRKRLQIIPQGKNQQFDKKGINMSETSTELSIATQINELHAQAESLARMAKDKAEEALSAALECGRLLISQKKSVGHGNWLSWVDDNCNFTEETARKYMIITKKFLDNSNSNHGWNLTDANPKNLRQAYIATGILPDIPKPDNGEKLSPSVVHVRHIDALVLWYRKTVEIKPASLWKPIAREALINDLAPLMEIYNELIDIQESMAR